MTRRGVAALTLLAPLLAAACTSADSRGAEDGSAAAEPSAALAPFVPGADPGDPGTVVLGRYLALSMDDADADPATLAELTRCAADDEPYLPIERLAAWEITGRTVRGDTTVVRARVVTVAEQNVSPTDPLRFVAVQRVRRGEWEWDVVREADGWRVCNGPRFGVHAPDDLTTWRPAEASSATARALADSVRRSAGP